MKIAVVYSGEPRSFTQVKFQHDEFFDGFEVDTYHSTWTKTSKENLEIIKKACPGRNISTINYNVPERPDLIRFEKVLLNMKKNHPIFMLGRIQYMTSMALHSQSWEELNKYDFIVRMRYDFTYDGKFSDLIKDSYSINIDDIFITRKMGGKSSPINIWDGFAFGRPYAMSLYFDFNKWIPFSLYNKDILGWKFQPEFAYGTYLRHVQLNVIDCQVQPNHIYWEGMNVDDHRTTRTIQYYRDLVNFHPEYYYHKDGKLIIENDSPTVSDELIINKLAEEGYKCVEV